MIWESVRGDDVDEAANVAALMSRHGVRRDAPTGSLRQRSVVPALLPEPMPSRSSCRSNAASPPREGSGTVMVPVERLDELVRMVGEAAAAHLRVGRVLTDRLGVDAANLVRVLRVVAAVDRAAGRTPCAPAWFLSRRSPTPCIGQYATPRRSLGKDVRWEVRGEDTELDRGVLHQLADSLLHLVRNAVDHGIDTPDRGGRGKAGTGRRAVACDATRLRGRHCRQRRRWWHRPRTSSRASGAHRHRCRRPDRRRDHPADLQVRVLDHAVSYRTSPGVASVSTLSGQVSRRPEAASRSVRRRELGSEFRIVVPITLAVFVACSSRRPASDSRCRRIALYWPRPRRRPRSSTPKGDGCCSSTECPCRFRIWPTCSASPSTRAGPGHIRDRQRVRRASTRSWSMVSSDNATWS